MQKNRRNIETYESMPDADQIDTAIKKAEEEFADNGTLIDAREALTTLRRKHFG